MALCDNLSAGFLDLLLLVWGLAQAVTTWRQTVGALWLALLNKFPVIKQCICARLY